MTPLKSEAESFIKLLEQCRRGRLLLYLGPPAAQAQRLLEAAQYLRRRGLEVVLVYWEPPGAAGPDPGLERLPRQRLEYRSLAVEEMDLSAVLARRLQVAVVQDLAHANVPGASHASRHQDVQEMLGAGISVLASADPWQLEGLPGKAVSDGAAVRRQILPAWFWRRADQIALVEEALPEDASPAGRPCPWRPAPPWRNWPAPWPRPRPRPRASTPTPALASWSCLPQQKPETLALLRGVQKMPCRNGERWFAVHVKTNAGQAPQLDEACQEAQRLGAEVALLEGKDPLATLLDFARAHGVRHIVLGRPRGAAWKGLFGFSLGFRLLRQASDFDLHILDLAEMER